jgi:dTDP-4-dehydrorhamnose reductase
MKAMEWWGGVECTINRVGDTYFNQLERTGHNERLEDLDCIAELGVRRIRFPLLWEQHWRGSGDYDFAWADARMERLQRLNVEPIVGLVHHGSGPDHTHLLCDEFAPGLAHFASAVARRYPWVKYFTPVNEPLTTARFSALYGHWYPHARDARSFVRALLNQTRATEQAMTAIRRVNPGAKLIQTEDIGAVFSTPGVAYQAQFENERRWLSLDLLCGRVDARHPLYRYLVDVGGAGAEQLAAIARRACPPNIVGVNYYVTSDRFLDERVEYYPEYARGSNGRHAYADVEAVRVLDDGIVGHARIIDAVWRRYGIPIAITEVHLGCSEQEQVLWLSEAWSAARQARAKGADVRAVTAWSLFGAFDWDSLVTCSAGHYEPGAFDVRHTPPRPTLVAEAIRQLARGKDIAADSALGWWRRKERLLYPPHTLNPAVRFASDAA